MQNEMRDRLVNLINQDNCPSPFMCSNECQYAHLKNCCGDRLADHLIENGVIVPPCKVGERVYSIRKDTKVIYECVVCEFILKKHYDKLEKECKVYILEDNRFTYFDFSSFGKTVFLTKEEAEAKLRERN